MSAVILLLLAVSAFGQSAPSLSKPVIASPKADETLPSTVSVVKVAWKPVPGAAWYGVRMVDQVGWLRVPGNNCGGDDAHYFCRNGVKEASLSMPVWPGQEYHMWVFAFADESHYSAAGFRDFRTAPLAFREAPGRLLRLKLLQAWSGFALCARRTRRAWAVRVPPPDPTMPVFVFPAYAQVFPSTATEVLASWRPVDGAYAYSIRVWDEADNIPRDPRNNCEGGTFTCLEYWDAASLSIPLLRGHSYGLWVEPHLHGGKVGAPAAVYFKVQGPGRAEPRRAEASLEEKARRELERLEKTRKGLAALKNRYKIGDPSRLRDDRERLRYEGAYFANRSFELEALLKQTRDEEIVLKGLEMGAVLISREAKDAARAGTLKKVLTRRDLVVRLFIGRDAMFRDLVSDESAWQAVQRTGRSWTPLGAAAALALLGGAGIWLSQRLRVARDAPSEGRFLRATYHLEKVLGRGGMGLVYEASDLGLKRKVAIKCMNPEAEDSAVGLGLFLNEARLVAALKHPHIVEIYEVFEEQGRVYLVFEHAPGGSLQARLDARGRLPLAEVKELLAQAGAALDYAHARGVVHRDLKPSNMILSPGGLKVTDFGLARRVVNPVTRTRGWGTPAYMAPEQELGTVSKEGDLYALGVCLYKLATGNLPFPGPDFLAQKQSMEYVPPSVLVSELPKSLDETVAKALSADPDGRFGSAEELVAALGRV